MGLTEKAEALYNSILEVHPAYLDALYRLGFISFYRGNHSEAKALFERGADLDRKTSSILLGWSFSQLDKVHWRTARKLFEDVLIKIDKRDLYSLCGAGHIYIK
jgi:tetratricopeptide (TPR) repeat protein